MRWLLIVLLVSVVALLVISASAAIHIWRAHTRKRPAAATEDVEREEAP